MYVQIDAHNDILSKPQQTRYHIYYQMINLNIDNTSLKMVHLPKSITILCEYYVLDSICVVGSIIVL